jgi:hypothetical protein
MFTTLELIREHGFVAPVFYEKSSGWGSRIIENISFQNLLPTRDLSAHNKRNINDIDKLGDGLLRQSE